MLDRPPLPPLFLSILAVALLIYGRNTDPLAEYIVMVGWLLLIFAVVWFGYWGGDNVIDWIRRLWDSFDRQGKLAETLQDMNSEQLRTFRDAIHISIDIDVDGKKYMRNTNAPLEFVQLFLNKSTDIYLCPVSGPTQEREWHEGSNQRQWAQQVTSALCVAGYAEPARGPFPARWVDEVNRRGIAAAMGIRLDNHSPTDPGLLPYGRN